MKAGKMLPLLLIRNFIIMRGPFETYFAPKLLVTYICLINLIKVLLKLVW